MNKKNNTVKIIDRIVNVTEITNKWLMWCEGNAPDQSVFVPSIFQMRDAYSHFIKLFGNGFSSNIISLEKNDFDTLFTSEQSVKQLEEAFTHCTRAFYDCADYILLTIKRDIDETEKNNHKMFFKLRTNLLTYATYISELRSAKSEGMEESYENIKKWDSLLQLITSSYVFGDVEYEFVDIIERIKNKLDFIESKFSEDVIKNHYPKFYEDKNILLELEDLPKEYKEYLNDESVVLDRVLENPEEWTRNITCELSQKMAKAIEYCARLDGLQKIMKNTHIIRKRKGILKAIWGVVSVLSSWLLTNILSSAFLFDYSITLQEQSQTISATKINFILLFPFIVIGILIFFIGYFAIGLVFKLILKKSNR